MFTEWNSVETVADMKHDLHILTSYKSPHSVFMLTMMRYFIMEEGSSQTKDRLPGDNYGRAWYSDIQVGVPKHEVLWI